MKFSLTKKDIAVTAVCIFVLLMTLGLVGRSGRRRARLFVCQSNLRIQQEAQIAYWDDHGGQLLSFVFDEYWYVELSSYLSEVWPRVRFCPEADNTAEVGVRYFPGGSFVPWNYTIIIYDCWGSYGYNGWLYRDSGWITNEDIDKLFLNSELVEHPERTPVLGDCRWVDAWPTNEDLVPYWHPGYYEPDILGGESQMWRYWMDRHHLSNNFSFVDGHVEAVGLEDMWTLYWHRQSVPNYDVVMPY